MVLSTLMQQGDFKTEILRVRANLIIYRCLSLVPSQEQNCITQNFTLRSWMYGNIRS